MNIERLLESLTNADNNSISRQPDEDKQRLMFSVKSHLVRILNTRRGTVLIDKEFGIPDFSDLPGSFASPKTLEIQNTIQSILEKYEPRISEVIVTFEGVSNDKLSIHFKLTGILKFDKARIPMVLRASMTSDNNFSIN